MSGKSSKKVTKKIVVTSPEEAKKVLRNHLKTSSRVLILQNKSRWATTSMINEEMKKSSNSSIDVGWLGRALNSANGVITSTVRIDGCSRTAYKIS